jgi:TRAP-type C4-dicarboxylate transport system substrate-binding protein
MEKRALNNSGLTLNDLATFTREQQFAALPESERKTFTEILDEFAKYNRIRLLFLK